MSQYPSHSNANSFNNNSFNTVSYNWTAADDGSQMLTWLSPLEPGLRHRDIQDSRVEGIGEWVLQTEEFRSWYAGSGGSESDDAVLLCHGDPGVGKTFISSLVIDRLCSRAKGQNASVACFYFNFAVREEQSPAHVLGALLKQLVHGLERIPDEISLAYQGQKNTFGERGPQLADIVKMLQTTTPKKPAFICIDALDECVAGYRVKLLNSLNKVLQKSPGTRVFVTGRPHIRAEVEKRLTARVKAIHITPRRRDIISYLHSRLDEDATPDAMDSSLRADILKKIPEDISEIFLLVSLNVDAILAETTIRRRQQKLNAMADVWGLEEAYGETLSRVKGQAGERSRLGMAALMWISHSERSLKVVELCHALGVEIGSENLDAGNVPSIGTLLACCQGLVVVDKEASAVRLIHLTLREYLRAHPELFGTAHSTMAETCLSYLSSHQVKALSASPLRSLWLGPYREYFSLHSGAPFLEYSSLHWGTHAKRNLSDCAKQLALRLFDGCSDHVSTKILMNTEKSRPLPVNLDKLSLFSGLHLASFFGIVEIVVGLVEVEGCNINQTDCTGSTPLLWAALKGHEGVVKILLGLRDVKPNQSDIDSRTPLSWAARNGHEGVVEMLLGREDIDLNKPDRFGQTPLYWAVRNGHEGVVKILLGRDDVSPRKPDEDGRTPLWQAVTGGYEGVVRALLGRGDVGPDTPDRFGRTPFWCAAEDGDEELVKILLGRDDVNPDNPDMFGHTPLWCASLNGHEGVVRMLLGRGDVNPYKLDGHGRTPLWCATRRNHARVIALLRPPESMAFTTE